jgi:hypothetical protein
VKISELIAAEMMTPQDAEAAAIKRASDNLKQRKAALKVSKAEQSLRKAQQAKLQALKSSP